jgi:hypothetical protein
MGRYVILRHEGAAGYKPGVHWDLMLETGSVLRTWALVQEPVQGVAITAEQLPDHRLAYLDFEGPLSGNRGTVARCDFGLFELVSETALTLVAALAGNRWRGEALLAKSSPESNQWRFELRPFAR